MLLAIAVGLFEGLVMFQVHNLWGYAYNNHCLQLCLILVACVVRVCGQQKIAAFGRVNQRTATELPSRTVVAGQSTASAGGGMPHLCLFPSRNSAATDSWLKSAGATGVTRHLTLLPSEWHGIFSRNTFRRWSFLTNRLTYWSFVTIRRNGHGQLSVFTS